MNTVQKYLPIGTVVMLKGGSKRLMITGFCSMPTDEDKMFDYAGCMYPEGFLSSDQTALFNHEQIEKIYYMGYIDEEEKKFKESLNVLLNEIDDSDDLSSIPPIGPGLPGYSNPVNNNVNNNQQYMNSNQNTTFANIQFDNNF